MNSRNIGLRLVEVVVFCGLFFAAVAPLFTPEEEKREDAALVGGEILANSQSF